MRALLLALVVLLPRPPARPPAPPGDTTQLQAPLFAVHVDASAGFRPLIQIGRVLDGDDLAEAVRSGLPLRVRGRVELWRDGTLFDGLEGSQEWTGILLYDPLDSTFVVRESTRSAVRRFSKYEGATAELERAIPLPLRPHRPGRYYYTARLDVETLSVSDLQELQHWLEGELGPAVSGDASIPSAVEQGMKRLLIRVLGLPTERLEARSDKFRVR